MDDAPEPIRVLYIDDDEALARLVQKALARRGYEVTLAATAASGLAAAEVGAFDVVALDHNLDTGTGLDVIARLRDRENAPPVVYVTASTDTAVAVAALKAGAYDYVPKAVSDQFIELLASALDAAVEKGRFVAEKARAEREIREARDRAELLLGEVNHRVANSLALVASLARLQAGALTDPAAKQALEETQARISAIAGIHRRLYTSHDIRFVEIDEYLASLASELSTAMQEAGHRSAIRLDVEHFRVPTDKAVSIGVIVTELVTNAYKYAYRDREPGEVRIRLHRKADETAELAVEDDGVGWAGGGKAAGSGLGTKIVKAMAVNLGSVVAYGDRSAGTQVSFEFKV